MHFRIANQRIDICMGIAMRVQDAMDYLFSHNLKAHGCYVLNNFYISSLAY